MQFVTISILLAFAAEAHAELKVWPIHQADQDDATLAALGQVRINTAPLHYAPRLGSFPLGSRTPYEHPHPVQAPYTSSRSKLLAASSLPKPVSEAVEEAADWPMMNIFDEPLKSCSDGEGDYFCTFDHESPAVCVSRQPHDDNTVPIDLFHNSQCLPIWGPWSDASSKDENSFEEGIKNEDPDLIIKCNALPADVLQSDISYEKWNSCELDLQESFTSDHDAMAGRCERFHNILEHVCKECGLQATTAVGKNTLASKCAMLNELMAHSSTGVFGIRLVGVIGLLVGSAAAFAIMLQLRHRPSPTVEQPLL